MFLKTKTLLKRRLHPYVLLAASLSVVLMLTVLGGLLHYNYELDHEVKRATVVAGVKKVAAAETTSPAAKRSNSTDGPVLPSPTKTWQTRTSSAPHATETPASPKPAPVAPSTVDVSLSVNGVYKGQVTVLSAGNQCDVLQEAFDAGVISSLDMRHSSQYKTYAVYVIDGIGDSSAVWWAYTVNGKSPPYGCSKTKVAGGDSVSWKYVKQ